MDNSKFNISFAHAEDNPCVRNCCLDSNDVCLGCFRHLSEITAWYDMSLIQRKDVISICDFRRQEHMSAYGNF